MGNCRENLLTCQTGTPRRIHLSDRSDEMTSVISVDGTIQRGFGTRIQCVLQQPGAE